MAKPNTARRDNGLEVGGADPGVVMVEDKDILNLFAGTAIVDVSTLPEAAQVFLEYVTNLEKLTHRIDLRNKAEFHALLWQIASLCEADLVEAYVHMEQPHLGVTRAESGANIQSEASKMSRWINGRSTPDDLDTRRRVIASSMQCLLESVRTKMAFALRQPNSTKRCRVLDTDGDLTGIGIYKTMLN